jgi:KDO2-lipid IV(A) lauroyltransferase
VATDRVTAAYKAAAAVARALPGPVMDRLGEGLGLLAASFTPERRFLVERNMRRALGPDATSAEVDRAVRRAYASYGRYYAESFRLPTTSPAAIDAGMAWTGYEHIRRAIKAGTGPLLVLPHLGGWEWAAFWTTQLERTGVTGVVEPLEPPSLFEFFVDLRSALGMTVVPLGPSAGTEVIRAIRRGDVICLLTDRDLEGTGVEVEFFGERTTLPAGPATLALRTGAPLLPSGMFFEGRRGHRGVILPPVPAERRGKLRDDVTRITQDLAHQLEAIIRMAPEQWHLMQPNWPSDHDALAARRS